MSKVKRQYQNGKYVGNSYSLNKEQEQIADAVDKKYKPTREAIDSTRNVGTVRGGINNEQKSRLRMQNQNALGKNTSRFANIFRSTFNNARGAYTSALGTAQAHWESQNKDRVGYNTYLDNPMLKARDANGNDWTHESRMAQFEGQMARGDALLAKSQEQLDDAKLGLGKVGQFGVDALQQGLLMGSDIALGAVTGGVGGIAAMGARAYGQGANEARQDGYDINQQAGYGLLSASVEMATEKLFQGVSLLGKAYGGGAISEDMVQEYATRWAKNMAKTKEGATIAQALAKAGMAGVGEGVEEVLSDLANPLIKKMVSMEADPLSAKDIGRDFLMGAVLGAVTGGGSAVLDNYQGKGITDETLAKAVEDGSKLDESSDARRAVENYKKDIEAGKQITDAQKKEIVNAVAQETNANYQDASDLQTNASLGGMIGIEFASNEDAELANAAITKELDTTRNRIRKMMDSFQGLSTEEEVEPNENATVENDEAMRLAATIRGLANGGSIQMHIEQLLPGNEMARQIFQGMTGITLDDSVEGTRQQVLDYMRTARLDLAQNIGSRMDEEFSQMYDADISATDTAQSYGEHGRTGYSYAVSNALNNVRNNSTMSSRAKRDAVWGTQRAYEAYYSAGVDSTKETRGEVLARLNDTFKDSPLTKSERMAAFMAGENDKAQLHEAIEKVSKKEKPGKGRERAKAKRGTVDVRTEDDAFTEEQIKTFETFAKALNVNIRLEDASDKAGVNGFYDNNGTIVVYKNVNGDFRQNPYVTTVAHEFTHHLQITAVKEYQAFKDYVTSQLNLKAPDGFEKEISKRIKSYKEVGQTLTREQAIDEILADSAERFLTDPEFARELANKNKSLAEKLVDFLTDFIAKVKALIQDGSKLTNYGEFYDTLEIFEQARDLYAQAIEASVDNEVLDKEDQRLILNGGEERMSIATWFKSLAKTTSTQKPTEKLVDKIASGKEVTRDTMLQNGFTEEDFAGVDKFMDAMSKVMEEAGVKYHFLGIDDINNAEVQVRRTKKGKVRSVIMSAMVKNGEYPVNFDFTTVCKKRQTFMKVLDELSKNGTTDTISLDADKLFMINQALKEEGIETACLGCFVEARRYNIKNYTDKVVNLWNGLVDEVRAEQGLEGEAEYFNFGAEGADVDSMDFESVEKAWNEYAKDKNAPKGSPTGRLKTILTKGGADFQKYLRPSDLITEEGVNGLKAMSHGNKNLFTQLKSAYGTAAPKEVNSFTPYNNEIALLPKTISKKATGKYLRGIGGVRMQSFSDFLVANTFDYMQMVADLAARKFPAHAYTKEIAFARIFGMTGIKINMSVMFDMDTRLGKGYGGLRFVTKEEYDLIKKDYPIKEDYTLDGVDGYLIYNVADQENADRVEKELYDKAIAEGKSVEEAHKYAMKNKPFAQSINWKEAKALQNEPGYSDNIGTIGVGFSARHIRMMMRDPNIRYIIPYHASGMPGVIKARTNLDIADDFTDYQNTRRLVVKSKGGQEVKMDLKKYLKDAKGDWVKAIDALTVDAEANGWSVDIKGSKALAGHGDFDLYSDLGTKTPEEKAQEYMDWCADNGYVPLFHEFATEDGYYKTLFDFNVKNAQGETCPQGVVTNKYPGIDVSKGETDTSRLSEIIDAEMNLQNNINQYIDSKVGNVVDDISQQWADMAEEEAGRYSRTVDSEGNELSLGQLDFFDESQARDDDGNLLRMFHGTNTPNFTVFDPSFSDDGRSLFFTSNPKVADSYTHSQDHGKELDAYELPHTIKTAKQFNDYQRRHGNDMTIGKITKASIVKEEEKLLERIEKAKDDFDIKRLNLSLKVLRDNVGLYGIFSNGEFLPGWDIASDPDSLVSKFTEDPYYTVNMMGNKYPVYLNIVNPLVIDATEYGVEFDRDLYLRTTDEPGKYDLYDKYNHDYVLRDATIPEVEAYFEKHGEEAKSDIFGESIEYLAGVVESKLEEFSDMSSFKRNDWVQEAHIKEITTHDNISGKWNNIKVNTGNTTEIKGKITKISYDDDAFTRISIMQNDRVVASETFPDRILGETPTSELVNYVISMADLDMDLGDDFVNNLVAKGEYTESRPETRRMKTREVAQMAEERGHDGVIFKNLKDTGGYAAGDPGASTVIIVFNSNQVKATNNVNPTEDPDIRYSKSVDSDGKPLTVGQDNFFKDSKVRDSEGRLLRVFHGTKAHNITVFKHSRSVEQGYWFTSNEDQAAMYSGEEGIPGEILAEKRNPYDSALEYLRQSGLDVVEGEHDLTDEDGPLWEFKVIVKDKYGRNSNANPHIVQMDSYDYPEKPTLEQAAEFWLNDPDFYFKTENTSFDLRNLYETYLNITNPMVVDANEAYWEEIEFEGGIYSTNDLAAMARERGYDGIIIKQVSDPFEPMDVYVAFESNQIKSVHNLNPTEDPDIRYSLLDGPTDAIETMDEGLYIHHGWPKAWGILEENELADFMDKVGDRERLGKDWYRKLSKNSHAFYVKGKDEINNYVIISDGDFERPSIDRIYEIFGMDENDIEVTRRAIVETERKQGRRTVEIVDKMFGDGLVFCYSYGDSNYYREAKREYERGKGKGNTSEDRRSEDGGRSKESTEPLRRFSVSDEAYVTESTLKAEQAKNRRLEKRLDKDLAKERLKLKKDKAIAREKRKHREYKANQKEKKERREVLGKIKKRYENLYKTLSNPTDAKHLPDGFDKAVADFLAPFNFETDRSKPDSKSAQERAQRYFNVADLADKLEKAAEDNDSTLIIDPAQVAIAKRVNKVIQNKRLADLTLEELQDVYKLMRLIDTVISKANKSFTDGITASINERAQQAIQETRDRGKVYKKGKAGDMLNQYLTSNTKPRDFFRVLTKEGGALYEAYMGMRRAFNRHIDNMTDFRNAWDKAVHYKQVKEWRKQSTKFKLESGKEIRLTVPQVMALYELNKRDQARGHIYGVGIVATDEELSRKAKKEDKGSKKENREAFVNKRVMVTVKDVENICRTLTDDQRKVANNLQRIMNTMGSEWGNQASLTMYNYKKFTEKDYFPISVLNTWLDEKGGVSQAQRIRTLGMTKQVQPQANNPLVLDDIFSVTIDHMNKMSMYTMTPELTDFERIWNYKNKEEGVSLREEFEATYGKNASAYVRNLMDNVNGYFAKDENIAIFDRMLSTFKRAKVGASLRVLVQQPTAILRAGAYINPAYITAGMSQPNFRKARDEMFKYSQIARWKSWGFYETDTAKSMESIIENKRELADLTMGAYGVADNMAWVAMWNAIKIEVGKKNPKIAKGSPEFFEKVAERFEEVVDHTQVVDSVFHRSQLMRSKNVLIKGATAFMSEPTTTVNMLQTELLLAHQEAQAGEKGKAAKRVSKVMATLIATGVATSIASAAVDALRHSWTGGDDDDEDKSLIQSLLLNSNVEALIQLEGLLAKWKHHGKDEEMTYLDRWIEHTKKNVPGNINPLQMMPFIKDIFSIVDGYSVERADISLISNVWDSVDKFKRYLDGDSSYGLPYIINDAIGSVGELAGIPYKNFSKDVIGLLRTGAEVAGHGDYANYLYNSTMYSQKSWNVEREVNSWLIARRKGNFADADKIRKSMMDKSGMTEADFNKVVKKMATDGLKDAIVAGDAETVRNARTTLNDAGWSKEDVDKVIQDTYKKAFREALETYDLSMINSISNRMRSEGFDKKDIVAMTKSKYMSAYKDAYINGEKGVLRDIERVAKSVGVSNKDLNAIKTVVDKDLWKIAVYDAAKSGNRAEYNRLMAQAGKYYKNANTARYGIFEQTNMTNLKAEYGK